MKKLFYVLVAVLVRVTSWFTFSRIEVRGLDRVSWDEPCVVSPNHQNAFLDALLVGVFAPVTLTFLSRAAVFGTPFDWFLEALHMVPIYRRRDGFDKLSRNHGNRINPLFSKIRSLLTCDARTTLTFVAPNLLWSPSIRPIWPFRMVG